MTAKIIVLRFFKSYYPDGTLVRIDNYRPGDAINRGIGASAGELLVLLSAHCIPADENWLANMIKAMDIADIGAAYGRQLPLPSSHPFDKRDLLNTFGLEARIQKIGHIFP